jgi:predicted Zn-dependent peptidase
MSSRLWRRVREELGAAYYVGAHAELLLDHGNFTMSAGVDHSKLLTVVSVCLEEVKRISEEEVPPKELQKAKDHTIGNFIMGLETSDQLANYYGAQEILTGKPLSPEEVIACINKVTSEDIKKVAEEIFQENRLHLAILGPNANEEELRKLLKM